MAASNLDPVSDPEPRAAIEMRGINKRFPLVIANEQVDFSVRWGEVHALVGENGAGKSTLMKILYGLYSADSGEISVDGKPAHIREPRDAILAGIGMIHQHFMLVETLTVAENVVLGSEPMRGVTIDFNRARAEVDRLASQYGLDVRANTLVGELSVGQQQRVEILKTLYRGAKIMIMDEPTAVLTPQESHELFKVLRGFAAAGNAIVFISHKLQEVMEVSDRVTVMRDGRRVGTVETAETSPAELARMMVGREILFRVRKTEATPGDTALKVTDLVLQNETHPILNGVSFQVRSGEIVGIAGVEGNGQTELVEVLTGLRRPSAGRITYRGRQVAPHTARTVREAGVGHIPEDRNARGLVADFKVLENVILGDQHRPPYASRFGLLDLDVIRKRTLETLDAFDVRPRSADIPADLLSGGNAQKLIVARELSRRPPILIASQPTRGIDIGAIEFVHSQLIQARDDGSAVLLVSADLNEILTLADRILVMYGGRITGELTPEEATEDRIGPLMVGITKPVAAAG
jgi:simple sugar transport system ATP-binding protein